MVRNNHLRNLPSVGPTSRVTTIANNDGRSFYSFSATSCRVSLGTENDGVDESLEEWIFAKLPSNHNVFDPSSPIFLSRFDSASGKVLYSCALCNGKNDDKAQCYYYTASQISQHCKLSCSHGNLIKKLYARRERIKNGMFLCRSHQFRLEPRIQQLGLQAWRNHVRSEMMVRFNTISGTGKRNAHVPIWSMSMHSFASMKFWNEYPCSNWHRGRHSASWKCWKSCAGVVVVVVT